MLNPSKIGGLAVGLPLTQSAYIAACLSIEPAPGGKRCPCVQARKRYGGRLEWLTGAVVELRVSTNGHELFKVATEIDDLWLRGDNLRLCGCGGNGRCAYAPDDARSVATC